MNILDRWKWYLIFGSALLALILTYVLIRDPKRKADATSEVLRGAIQDKIEIVKKADSQYKLREEQGSSKVEQIDAKLKDLEAEIKDMESRDEDVVSVSEFFRHLKL